MLMGLAATCISIEYAAKLAGLLLVGVNSALIWYLLARATNRYAYAAIGSAIIILSPQFVYLHSLAMSEPLFIFAILVTLLTLLRYWETEERTWLLARSEEHTSELQSLMRISYAVFCLKKKKEKKTI